MQITYSKKNEFVQKAANSTASSVLDTSSQGESLQRKADMANNATQRAEAPRPNNTGMPDNLKSGIESLSGFSMDDVRVHYNSSKPATVQALAYTQGTDIHVAPGQEKHLPHEAWHVAQQMAGSVSPTTNINGMPVNDNPALEHEADVMGEKAVQCKENKRSVFAMKKVSLDALQLYKRGDSLFNKVRDLRTWFIDQWWWNQGWFGNRDLNCLTKIKGFNDGLYDDVSIELENTVDDIVKKIKNSLNFILLNFFDSLTEEDPSKIQSLKSFYYQKLTSDKNLDDNTQGKIIHFLANVSDAHLKTVVNNKTNLNVLIEDYYKKIKSSSTEDSTKKESDKRDTSSTPESFENTINLEFRKGLDILKKIFTSQVSREKFDQNDYNNLKGFLNMNMNFVDIIETTTPKEQESATISTFVDEQVKFYEDKPARQMSAMILGVARKISYLLKDPWAENRIARLLHKEIIKVESKEKIPFFFQELSGFSRSNPLLMCANEELNLQDASNLIRIRASRTYSEIDPVQKYQRMLEELKKDAKQILKIMEDHKMFLTNKGDFDPAAGMFRLYSKERNMEMRVDNAYNRLSERMCSEFISTQSCEWEKKAKENAPKTFTKNDRYEKILKKLKEAPITLRLPSSSLQFQDGQTFYHSRPWFDSVKINDTIIPYHPLQGRENTRYYSLWRTFKDHFYRGKLWKRGKDGYHIDEASGRVQQSLEQGALQQSFASLNINSNQFCFGLINGFNYGNVSLVLKKNNILGHCIFTIGDYGVPYKSIEDVAQALANTDKLQIDGGACEYVFEQVIDAIEGKSQKSCEHLEVQIFKDIKFGNNGDIQEIYCCDVKNDSNEYSILKKMVGANNEKLIHCYNA